MPDNPDRSLFALIAGHRDQVVTVTQLVTLVESVKDDLIVDAQIKTDHLQSEVFEDSAALSALSKRILAIACTSTVNNHSTRSRGSSSRKRTQNLLPHIKNLEFFENPDICAEEYPQC